MEEGAPTGAMAAATRSPAALALKHSSPSERATTLERCSGSRAQIKPFRSDACALRCAGAPEGMRSDHLANDRERPRGHGRPMGPRGTDPAQRRDALVRAAAAFVARR